MPTFGEVFGKSSRFYINREKNGVEGRIASIFDRCGLEIETYLSSKEILSLFNKYIAGGGLHPFIVLGSKLLEEKHPGNLQVLFSSYGVALMVDELERLGLWNIRVIQV